MKYDLNALEQILEAIQSGESNITDVAKWKQGCVKELREKLKGHEKRCSICLQGSFRYCDICGKEVLGAVEQT